MIRYSCHSENFGILSREATFSLVKQLHFDCIDIASRSFLPQKEIQRDPNRAAAELSSLSDAYALPVSELFLGSVEIDGKPVSPSHPDADKPSFFYAFSKICQFAQKAGFLSIMGDAGVKQPALSHEQCMERTGRILQKQALIAAEHGIAFHVEPSRNSLLHTAEACRTMCRLAPSLRYTLDFLHFQYQGISQEEAITLLPLSGHLHARQAKKGYGKCDFSAGEIDYPKIVAAMKKQNWSGDIMLEFWYSPHLKEEGIDPIEQNIVMRYFLKQWFQTM